MTKWASTFEMNVRMHTKSNRAQLIICRVYIFQIDLMDQIQKKTVQSKENVSILSSNRRMLENSSREY